MHQSVVSAAVQAAAVAKIPITVVVIGGDGNGTHPPEIDVRGTTDQDAKLQRASVEVERMVGELAQRDARITAIEAERDALAARPAVGVAVTSSGGSSVALPQQPTDVVSIDTYSIDTLGIGDAEVVEKLKKGGYTTIGLVRAGYGNLKDLKLKGGNKTLIDIAERLMGKVPTERVAVAAGSAQPVVGALAPTGHTDRPWLDRLGAVKAKERDMRDYAKRIATVRAQHPTESAMPDEVYDQMLDYQREHDMAKAQVVALVWGLGLDKEPLRAPNGGVDDCLRAAGLAHLCEGAQPAAPATSAGEEGEEGPE